MKALVLGGGGTTGTAWQIGLLLGLHEKGVEVSDADLVIGTSAGSVTGAQITSGLTLEDLYALQIQPPEPIKERVVPIDRATLAQLFAASEGASDAQTARVQIGAVALAATTMSEEARLEIIADRLPVQHWPNKPQFIIPAIDAHTGELMVFDQTSAVPLTLAVAASTAFPCISPPVTIDNHRYIDGGFRSATNADLAKGSQRVLILSTITPEALAQGRPAGLPFLTFEDEQAQLQQAGAQVLVITPDEASVEAKGPNPSDSRRLALAAKAGREQGQQLAESVRSFWSNTKIYKLIGPDGKPYESTTPGTLGGYNGGKKQIYGRLDCPSALRWIAKGHYVEHRVFFADEPTAIAAGYRPCGICMKERYAEWKQQTK